MKRERLPNVIWLLVYDTCSWREQKELKLTSRLLSRLFKTKPLNIKALALNFKPGLCTLPRGNWCFVEKISVRRNNVDLTAYLSSLDEDFPNLRCLCLFGLIEHDLKELADLFARPQCLSRLTSLCLDSSRMYRLDQCMDFRRLFKAVCSKKIELNTTWRLYEVDSSFFGPDFFVTG